MKENGRLNVAGTVLIAILIFLLGSIFVINFLAVPGFYDGDMYCDYRYAMEAWKYKSLFPEGWIFGNQLNAVSTPVLAALIYGLSHNMNFSMAAACSLMALLVLISFDWMIKPVLKEAESRLVAAILLIVVSLYCGNAVHGNQGWTLLFSMCSYYAGYSITAFLAFGSYLRALSVDAKKQIWILILTCVCSFFTGIQSIRQTAIMIGPMLAVEFLRLVLMFQTWKMNRRPFWITLWITASNFLGLCCVRMMPINQNEIFGRIELTSLSGMKQAVTDCVSLIKDLLGADYPEALFVVACIALVCFGAVILMLINRKTENFHAGLALALFFCISIFAIVFIDVFTTMHIRPRYYFMLYPLIAFLVAYMYSCRGTWIRWCLLVLVSVFFLTACFRGLLPVCARVVQSKESHSYVISEYLLENGYTTIYAVWDKGEDLAIASNGELEVGYWNKETPFDKVTYLCNLDVYNDAPDKCVYYFEGTEILDDCLAAAEDLGAPLQLLYRDSDRDISIYTASDNLMQLVNP